MDDYISISHRDVLSKILDCYYSWQLLRLTSKHNWDTLGDYHVAHDIKFTNSCIIDNQIDYHGFLRIIQVTWESGYMKTADSRVCMVRIQKGEIKFRNMNNNFICALVPYQSGYEPNTLIYYNMRMFSLIHYAPYDSKSSLRYIRDTLPDIFFGFTLLKPVTSSDVE